MLLAATIVQTDPRDELSWGLGTRKKRLYSRAVPSGEMHWRALRGAATP